MRRAMGCPLRRAMRGRAATVSVTGRRAGLSAAQVVKHGKVPHPEREAKIRRPSWAKSIHSKPQHNKQLLVE
eukprot:2801483-Pyramimonas_sp.AAC.1